MRSKLLKSSFLIILIISLQSCMTTPPENPDNICLSCIFESIFLKDILNYCSLLDHSFALIL